MCPISHGREAGALYRSSWTAPGQEPLRPAGDGKVHLRFAVIADDELDLAIRSANGLGDVHRSQRGAVGNGRHSRQASGLRLNKIVCDRNSQPDRALAPSFAALEPNIDIHDEPGDGKECEGESGEQVHQPRGNSEVVSRM